ncbi:hypothetical protein [uncultured Thiohalocapsa sp.]|uniref:hypothetical protein n=1 Tax=uncultured Thiohalocapsa sp. TaxID=768990 RepID=UPI0025CD4EC4|nr:hypothetical protein [uncultured Thiohalocapsa sp.]
MTRGTQLKELTQIDLGHLGLAPDTLQGAMALAGDDAGTDPKTLAVTREVLETLEAVFDILTEALPGEHGRS